MMDDDPIDLILYFENENENINQPSMCRVIHMDLSMIL
jgi:hypothetical protein